MSETIAVAVKLRPGEALTRAVEALKGQIIGEGEHKFFVSPSRVTSNRHDNPPVIGYGFTLPDWKYPLVIDDKGALHYDNYGGYWGDIEKLHELQQEYALQTAEAQAQALGLYCERDGNRAVTVHFGEGRTVTVDWAGSIDAQGFNGVGCDTACEQFAAALGQTLTVSHKSEYFQERATVLEGG